MTACKSTATTAAVGVAGLANAGGLASEAADVAHQAHGNAAGDEAAVPKKKEKAKAGVGAEAEGTHAYKPAVKKVEVKKEADVAEASHTQRPAGASAAAKPRKRKVSLCYARFLSSMSWVIRKAAQELHASRQLPECSTDQRSPCMHACINFSLQRVQQFHQLVKDCHMLCHDVDVSIPAD